MTTVYLIFSSTDLSYLAVEIVEQRGSLLPAFSLFGILKNNQKEK